MANWQRSAAWRTYKAAFTAVGDASSPRILERLRRDLAEARPALKRLFEGHPSLVGSLDDMMNDRLQARDQVLARAQGARQRSSRHPGLSRREASPDLARSTWEASAAVAWLEHTEAALRGLRAAAIDDPWIDDELVPALGEGVDALEASVESLERLHPGAPEAAPILAQARRALSSARGLLGEGRPGR